MKKIAALLLAVIMMLTLFACGRKTNSGTETGGDRASIPGTMAENVTKIVTANPAEFGGSLIPLDLQDTSEEGRYLLKSYTGLDSAEDIADVAVYEPMMSAQAFSLVMLRVAPGVSTKTVAQQMKENIDPNKWVCVRADQVQAVGYGDTVMFVMLNSELGKTAQSYVEAFENLCGSKVDFAL